MGQWLNWHIFMTNQCRPLTMLLQLYEGGKCYVVEIVKDLG